MKTQQMGILNPINKEEMQELFKETKETLATDVHIYTNTFNAIDLWKVQKQRRATSLRMRRWNG